MAKWFLLYNDNFKNHREQMKNILLKFFFFYLLALFFCISLNAKEEIHFGVYADLGVDETRRKYQPLVDYLNSTLNKKVVMEVLTQKEMDEKIAKNELDIVTTNPIHFLKIRHQYPLDGAIATLVSLSDKGKPIDEIGGVIFVRSDSPIQTLNDIKGKLIVTSTMNALGGFQAQAYEFYRAGINLSRQKNKIIETHSSYKEVVHDIREQKGEVGFIRDGILEDMLKKGELSPGSIRILNEQSNISHPYKVSTRLYPEWPVFDLPHADHNDVKPFLVALLSLKPIKEVGIYGYALPSDYLIVEDLSRTLRLPPFDKSPVFTITDVWHSYAIEILILITLLSLVIIYYTLEQQRKRRFEALLSNIGDGVYGIDTKGRCIWINNQALNMLGYSKKEVLYKNAHALFHHHKLSLEIYEESECPVYLTSLDKQIRKVEDCFIRKDGTFFPVRLISAPINGLGSIVVFSDISERKQLEQELHEESELHKAIIDNVAYAIIATDQNGLITRFNHRAEEMLGYSAEEMIHKTTPILIHDYEEVVTRARAFSVELNEFITPGFEVFVAKTKRKLPNEHEWSYIRKNGERITVSLSVTALRDQTGNIYGYIGIANDITEKKWIQQEQQMSEERFRRLFENMSNGVAIYRATDDGDDFIFQDINHAVINIEGVEYEEVIGEKLTEVFPNVDALGLLEVFRRVYQTGHGEHYAVRWYEDDTLKGWRDNYVYKLPNEEIVAVYDDVTEQKIIEEALLKSEASLKKAQMIARIGSWELNLRTNNLKWSDEIFHIFEIDKNEFDASYEAFLAAIHPEDRSRVNQAYLDSVKTRQKYLIEHRLLMKDGRIKWVQEIGNSEYDNNGTPIISRGTVQDITEQYLINLELQETKEKLEEANNALKVKNDMLKEQAMNDGLTHIPNRRFFDEMYEQKYKEVLRDKKTLAVLMIDVDYFKNYNDFYGHGKGDECLSRIASTLKNSLKRPTDMIARYGGEEFVVVLKDIDRNGAKKVAEALVNAVSSMQIPHENSTVSDHVTISIGMAFKEIKALISKVELLKRSDDALYIAKKNGRNGFYIV